MTIPAINRPGHDEAIDAGCTCAVLDNGHGNLAAARDRGGYWIFTDCPLHGVGGSHPAEWPMVESRRKRSSADGTESRRP